MPDGTPMVSCMIFAFAVAEKGEAAGAAIDGGCGRKLVSSRSANIARADDDHAEAVAVALSAHEFPVEQTRRVSGGLRSVAKFRQRLRETGVSSAIGLDGGGYGFQIGESLLFIATDCGLVPFEFEGR